jgi:hypothetical protein
MCLGNVQSRKLFAWATGRLRCASGRADQKTVPSWKINQPPSIKVRLARLEGASIALLDDAVGIFSHPRWLAWC